MRRTPGFILASIFVFVLMGECAQASTTLYLPRRFELSQMATVGVAFVNPTTTAASATFRLRNAQGESVTTAERTIPSKGQNLISIQPDSSTAKVIGTTVTPNPGSDNIVTN